MNKHPFQSEPSSSETNVRDLDDLVGFTHARDLNEHPGLIPKLDDVIDHPAPCQRCEYDLQGLTRADNCPECGFPVNSSLVGYSIYRADPAYLKSIRSSAARLKHFAAIGVVFVVVAVFLSNFAYLAVTLIAAAHLASIYEWSRLAAPHADRPRIERVERARRALRAVLAVAAVTVVLGFILALIPPLATTGIPGAAGMAWLLLLAVRTFAALRFGHRFASIIPAPRTAKRFRGAQTCFTVFVITNLVLLVIYGIVVVALGAAGPNAGGFATIFGLASCFVAPVSFVVIILYVCLHIIALESLHTALRNVHRRAGQLNAAQGTPPTEPDDPPTDQTDAVPPIHE
ncbi:MAG: hypothetical protein AAF138_06725 [Planctomycetota bacterium]